MGREVDCRCCQEVPSAKGIQRDRERIDDVSSNMKTSESLLSASASPCVASERWRCHSDRRVRQCKWENDWWRTLKRNGQVYAAIGRRAKIGSFAKRATAN